MLADIATGNTDAADVLFLIAVIVAALGAVYALLNTQLVSAIILAAVAITSLAWLLL